MNRYEILISLIIVMFFACKIQHDDGYDQSILQWQKERLANLIKEDGWATLAGLFPLREGKQTFGSGKGNPIQFPPFAPEELGSFIVSNDSVHLVVNPGIDIRVADQPVSRILLAPVATPLLCTHGRLQWFLIQRGDQFLIRLRDTQHPARQSLTSLPYYPIDKKWRLEATFHPYDSTKILPLPNVLDMMVNNNSPGNLTFEYKGENYSILTVEEDTKLFLLFYDQTSGVETYGGGRYLYADRPKDYETTIIDFNKAYSPPCAFTEFATCLLPPPENRFSFAITAGEKDPHFLEH